MSKNVKRIISSLDNKLSNFGYSSKEKMSYGMIALPGGGEMLVQVDNLGNVSPVNNVGPGMQVVENIPPNLTNYSINPKISHNTRNCSTFMVTISVARTGTGSGNTFDPVFLFGSDAYQGMDTPYASVERAGQVVTLDFVNGKNVVIFTYTASAGNSTAYTVSLGTKGEYPFILNSLAGNSGNAKMNVKGVQIEISDVDQSAQLTNEMSTFELDEYGAASTNDLTTPMDLYQNLTNGVYIPHEFELSGRKGLVLDVQNVNGFVVKYYFYVAN